MHRAFPLMLTPLLLLSACGGARLSHGEIRKQISDIGQSSLVPNAVTVRRVVAESNTRAIAETTVELAFQFERDTVGSPWYIAAIRMGDQNWVALPELLKALNENRRQETLAALKKLDSGVAAFRQSNSAAPGATTITALADALHPQFMSDLVLDDAWGHPIEIERSATGLRFRSLGSDGQRNTPDDVVFPE